MDPTGPANPVFSEPVPAQPEEARAVRSLVREAYARWVPIIGREPTPMSADYDAAIRNYRVDVVRIDGALAGVIEMAPEDGHLLIRNVAVVPAWQGRGLGRRLLVHAEYVAAAMGYVTIRLYTNKLFAENIRLYLAAGYRIDKERPFMEGVTVYMSKQCSTAQ